MISCDCCVCGSSEVYYFLLFNFVKFKIDIVNKIFYLYESYYIQY